MWEIKQARMLKSFSLASRFSGWQKMGVFSPLWGSQAHPLLIMKLYKDSIKALNLLPNTERHRIPGVPVVNHTPACTLLTCSSAHNAADVMLMWPVTHPTSNGLYLRLIISAVTKDRRSACNHDMTALGAQRVTRDPTHSQDKHAKSLVIINSRGLLHQHKGGHLPLSIQAEVKAPPESLHERMCKQQGINASKRYSLLSTMDLPQMCPPS